MSDVTSEWLENMEEEFAAEASDCADHEWARHNTLADLASALRELLSRRAAEEGAVTVEVMGRILSIVGIPGMANTAVYEVTIRRKP